MTLVLRPYQEACVRNVREALGRGVRRCLYTLPTGTGKTAIFVGIRQALGCRALVLAHREELLDQAANRFLQVDPECCPQVEQGSRKASRWAQVIAASVQTLARGTRLDWFKPELIVIDEAHHATSPTHRKVLERFGAFADSGPAVVGCTATPKRLDRISLETVFEETVYSYSIRDAIAEGWLCDIKGFRVVTTTDLSKIKTTAGDYNQGQLAAAVDDEGRTAAAIQRWQELAADRPTIAFCASVEHARHAAEAWRKAGVRAEHVDGGMVPETRRSVLSRFQRGELQVLTNVELCTEGWDHPPLSCVVMLRPTQSWALYCQMVGRGTRLSPGKRDLLVLDVVDNSGKHELATVPAILDLPPGLDLQGKSLKQAADALDAVGEALGAAVEAYQPKLFSDIESMLEQVDLLGGVLKPPVEAEKCKLAWVKRGEDSFSVSCGRGPLGRREAHLQRIPDGRWSFLLLEGQRVVKHGHRSEETAADTSLWLADYYIRQRWPETEHVAAVDARWRQNAPTEKQQAALRKFRVSPEIIASLDRGAASRLLDHKLAELRR